MYNKQLNTWPQYVYWLRSTGRAWHTHSQRMVYWPSHSGMDTGLSSAASKHCAKYASDRGLARFGPAMRRWLKSPEGSFPPGWDEPRDLWRL